MALSIKDPETENLARQIARQTGESLTKAIQRALRERWERLPQRGRGQIMQEKLESILARVDALPAVDTRSEDDILGYDAQGMPR